jgi:hypothetical protein
VNVGIGVHASIVSTIAAEIASSEGEQEARAGRKMHTSINVINVFLFIGCLRWLGSTDSFVTKKGHNARGLLS